jgi:plastocyanin
VTRLTIEGKDDRAFTPATLTLQSGQQVELALVNNGKLPHTFSVSDLNIEAQMLPGKMNTLSFTSPAAGVHRFYSAVLDDFETMKGKPIVR